MTAAPPLPYELRIGVTGHRNLPDAAGTARAIDALMAYIQRVLESAAERPRGPCGARQTLLDRVVSACARCASVLWRSLPVAPRWTPPEFRTPLEWLVVSPLARGADRLVAKAVLGRPASRLQVVTPFAVDEYRKDFADDDDRAEFDELLKHDPAPVELPGDPGSRAAGYLRAGQEVVERSEILIAVWDGKRAAGQGGTGDIVEFALERGNIVLWIDSADPAAPVRALVARPSEGEGDGSPRTEAGFPHRPLPARAKDLSENFHRFAAFHRDAAFDPHLARAIAERNRAALLDHARAADLTPDGFAPWAGHFLPAYARADQLAIRYQSLHVRGAVGLYVASASAGTVAAVQVLLFPHALWLIGFEIALIGLALLLWAIGRNDRWHEKWLHDRHLAERIRMGMFLSLLSPRVLPAAPPPDMPFYPGPEGWVIDLADRVVKSAPAPAYPLPALKRFLVGSWVADQAEWHGRNARRKHRAATLARRGGIVIFATTLAMVVLHLSGVAHETAEQGFWDAAISCLAIVLPGWGGALHAVNVLRDRERIAARSERMHRVLSAVARRAEQATTVDALRAEVGRAAAVMASESHEWWVSLNYRELVLPA